MAELKTTESDAFYDPESEPSKGNEKGKKIIDVDPSAIFVTTKIHREDLEDPEEGEHLFHLQLWVKCSLLKFYLSIMEAKRTSFQQRS